MIAKIKELLVKYREIIVYLIVGGLTTVISWACMFFVNIVIFGNPLYPTVAQNLVLSIVNWTAGVASAYPMNRRWVFQSKSSDIFKECSKFVAGRVATLVLEIVFRQILGALGVDVFVTTLICAILVIIGNYILSKLFVFSKKDSEEKEKISKKLDKKETISKKMVVEEKLQTQIKEQEESFKCTKSLGLELGYVRTENKEIAKKISITSYEIKRDVGAEVELMQMDRAKGDVHIFQDKTDSKRNFLGKKLDVNGVKSIQIFSDAMDLKTAHEKLKEIIELEKHEQDLQKSIRRNQSISMEREL